MEGNPILQRIISKTIEYLSVPSVVGHEAAFMSMLEKQYQSMNMIVNHHTGLLSVSGRDPKSAIICAHIDRHGLITAGEGRTYYAAQFIKQRKYGQANILAQKQVQAIAKRFEGEEVYAYDPLNGKQLGKGMIHLLPDRTEEEALIFFVSGMQELGKGFPLAYAREARWEAEYLQGQIDNAISLAVIFELFNRGFEGTAIFGTEEEIGKSWVHICAYLEKKNHNSQSLLVLDTSPYDESEIIEQGKIILRNRDYSEEFNSSLSSQVKERCNLLELPFTYKDEDLLAKGKTIEQLGSTELGKIIKYSDRRWSGTTIQIPTLMYHTSNESTTTRAIENYFTLLHNILVEKPLSDLRYL